MKPDYALTNCNIAEIGTGTVLKDMVLLVDCQEGKATGGIIAGVEKMGGGLPPGYRVIDAGGKYLMPGLINAHVHLFSGGGPSKGLPNEKQQKRIFAVAGTSFGNRVLKSGMRKRLEALLQSGVTSVRCVGDPFYLDVKLRDEIEAGVFTGPSMKVSGYMISVTGGHGAPFLALTCDSPWEGRKRARQNIKQGVDFIKICVTGGVTDARYVGEAGRLQMTEEEVAAICDEAHKIGLLVASHTESTEGVRVALRGGVDTIEHGAPMDKEIIALYRNNPRSLRGYSAVVPTLQAAVPGFLDQKITGFSDVNLLNSRMVFDGMVEGLKQAMEEGIRVGLGTDAAMPYVTHDNTWRELEYLVRYAGFTPAGALERATSANAEIMGIDKRCGSLAKGKAADFILLHQCPFDNLKTLANPAAVAIGGKLMENPAIRRNQTVEDILNTL